MCVETVAREVAVVGLIVDSQGKVAVGLEEIAQVEVADETGSGGCIVSISELSIEEKPVVEEPATDESFIFGVVPTFVARGDVCAEVPIGAVDHGAEDIVDLLGELSA